MSRINRQEYQEILNKLYELGDYEWSSNSYFTSECEIASNEDVYTIVEDQSEYIMNGFNYWDVYLYKNGKMHEFYQVII